MSEGVSHRPFPGAKRKAVQSWRLLTLGRPPRLSLSGARGLLRMRSVFTHNLCYYTERYVERFKVTPCSERLVTTYKVSLRFRQDLRPGFTRRTNSPRITIEKRETARVKTVYGGSPVAAVSLLQPCGQCNERTRTAVMDERWQRNSLASLPLHT